MSLDDETSSTQRRYGMAHAQYGQFHKFLDERDGTPSISSRSLPMGRNLNPSLPCRRYSFDNHAGNEMDRKVDTTTFHISEMPHGSIPSSPRTLERI